MIEIDKAVSIGFVNQRADSLLKNDAVLYDVTVKGEVSGLSRKKHAYFTLKEPNAQIQCNMWSSNLNNAPLFKDGMEVYVRGSLGIYSPYGKYALDVKELEPTEEAKGKMAKILEERIKRLKKEGLFDYEHKKPIPDFPKRVAIISSDSAAGYGDLLDQIKAKNDYIDIELYPVFVQGIKAEPTICKAFQMVNERGKADLIILARGGGSKEDLSAFDEEGIARAIFNSKIPVITAIGHQKDSSIADLVADKIAITPTASAQYIPDMQEIRTNIDNMLLDLESTVYHAFVLAEQRLETLKQKLEKINPLNIIDKGFGALLDSSGQQIMSVSKVAPKDRISILLRDGSINATVDAVSTENELAKLKVNEGEGNE